jgi:hypothetical protein
MPAPFPQALVALLPKEPLVLAPFPDEQLVPNPPPVPDPLQPVKVCFPNRLLGHAKVECARMTQTNWARMAARFQQSVVELSIAATTEVHFNGQNVDSLGQLGMEAQRGMSLHRAYAVLPKRDPLGKPDE